MPATAGQLAEQLPVTRQAVVKHLAVLEAAGLVVGEHDGRRVVFRLTPAPMIDAARWMQSVGSQWDERLEKLATRVRKSR